MDAAWERHGMCELYFRQSLEELLTKNVRQINKQTETFSEQSELVSFTFLMRRMSAEDPILRRCIKMNFHCV
jgi:hypothetical protein